jgi:type IV secretory pathway VirB10-like protein
VPFGVAFALSRRRAFLAGCGAGASGAIALVGAVMLTAWLLGRRSENRGTTAPTVSIASKTEQASAPVAAANATIGRDRAAPHVPRRVKHAARIAAPVLVEEVAASHPTAVDRQPAVRADDEDGEDSPASSDGSEPKQLAEAEDGEASAGAVAQAQTTEEQVPALDEGAAAAAEAQAQADESSNEPSRVALLPAVDLEQARSSDGAPGAPANEDPGQ